MRFILLKKTIISFLLVLSVAVCLLNSNAFGASSLIAYFFYSIIAAIFSFILFFKAYRKRYIFKNFFSAHSIIFLALSSYIFLHGVITDTFGLTHFYWITLCIFLFAATIWVQLPHPDNIKIVYNNSRKKKFIYAGIAGIAFLDSTIVLLQCVQLFPVPNSFFLCTGTWANPNVTAIFLSLSIFAVLRIKEFASAIQKKLLILPLVTIIVLSILMLQCRSAYLATAVLLFAEYRIFIKRFFIQNLKFTMKGFALCVFTLVAIQIFISFFEFKEASTSNRIQIWKNSIELISGNPIGGYGFGMFEKEYNLFAAQQKNPVNDHIYMPFNDFLELGVEGGLIAIVLWVAFLLHAGIYCYRNENSFWITIPLIVSFIIIQLTNFAIHAIPAMVLFILYVALAHQPVNDSNENSPAKLNGYRFRFQHHPALNYRFGLAGAVISLVMLFHITGLTISFYEKWMITKSAPSQSSITSFKKLRPKLNSYTSYHEALGDSYLSQQQTDLALSAFKRALVKSSSPEILAKTAFCYQIMGRYDSSEYYFTLIQNMQPHKFMPRLALLKLYKQENDSGMIVRKANEIIKMPVKIRSRTVYEIKRYAAAVADSISRVIAGIN